MDTTIKLIAKTLGAAGVEVSGADARFAAEAADGSRLKISIEGRQQRFMGALVDAAIRSLNGGSTQLRYGRLTQEVKLAKGKTHHWKGR